MLSEISQTEKDKYCMVLLTCGIKKAGGQTHRNRLEWWLPGAKRWGRWGEVDKRVHIFSYKMNKFWGCNVQRGHYSYQYSILYSKVVKRMLATMFSVVKN